MIDFFDGLYPEEYEGEQDEFDLSSKGPENQPEESRLLSQQHTSQPFVDRPVSDDEAYKTQLEIMSHRGLCWCPQCLCPKCVC